MKSACWNAEGRLDVVDRILDAPPPGWAGLSVVASGICGSDLHGVRAGRVPVGSQPGHEVAGVIETVGDDVSLSLGTSVALEPIHACGSCGYCRRGNHNLCQSKAFIGFGLPGGMAETVLVPANRLYEVPKHLPKSVQGLTEPLAVCVRGARIGAIEHGQSVTILGAGTIGLLSIVTARAAGARDVFITARHPHQRAMAQSLGARAYLDCDALVKDVGEVDVVVETVGGESSTLIDACRAARAGGTIVMLGVFGGDTPLPGFMFFNKEITLKASNCYACDRHLGDYELTVKLLEDVAPAIEPLVTHTFALDQINDAFAAAFDKSTGSVKVQVHP